MGFCGKLQWLTHRLGTRAKRNAYGQCVRKRALAIVASVGRGQGGTSSIHTNRLQDQVVRWRIRRRPQKLDPEVKLVIENCRDAFDHASDISLGTDSADADLPGLLGQLRRMVQRDHQNGRTRRTRCNLFRRVQPIHAGHLKVEHDDVELFFLEFGTASSPSEASSETFQSC